MRGKKILSKYFNKLSDSFLSKRKLTIVTGANSIFFTPLKNLLFSVQEKEPEACVIIWDLGLTAQNLEEIQLQLPLYKVYKFPFDPYPSYFNIHVNAGEYAWKPVCIFESYRLINVRSTALVGCWLPPHRKIKCRTAFNRIVWFLFSDFFDFGGTSNLSQRIGLLQITNQTKRKLYAFRLCGIQNKE